MYILGISANVPGSSACLLQDGQLVAAAEEERFRRIKYWAGFPVQSIRFVLKAAGINAYDLDHIGLSTDPNANLLKKVLFTLSKWPEVGLLRQRLSFASEARGLKAQLCQSLALDPAALRADFHHVEHHRAHMASAFFVSPFESAAILSVDGMGDFVSTMWGVGRGNSLEVLGAINFPHSLGWLYTAISQWLGFAKYGDEGKVMGLAAYGEPAYLGKLREVVQIQRDGTFRLNRDYFVVHTQSATMSWPLGAPVLDNLFSTKLIDLLGEPRTPRSKITKYHNDVAASLQAMLEEAEFALMRKLQRDSGQKSICMAGGVALNSSFNGKVLPNTLFEDIFIQPAASDAGTALGAAYYIYHQILDHPRCFVMNDAYIGPGFGNGTIEQALRRHNLDFSLYDDRELSSVGAQLVAEGKVLGWFQERMEWGPRALGNRSIIADPRQIGMRDILNARVKHRERFRPFAPSILLESVGDYFDQSYPDPFMIKIYNVTQEKRAEIPAVTHVDGTGRLQTVNKLHSPMYWSLINAFKEQTGTPVVLNTSFNENEPIVCTPQEAVSCFLRTQMDALAIGNYLVIKG